MRHAHVRLGDVEVGVLESDGQRSRFDFVHDYRTAPTRRVLSQHYENLGLAEDVEPARAVPAFFSNLLPEEKGELRTLMKQQHRFSDDFELLLLLGQDLPGAVTVTQAAGVNAPTGGTRATEATQKLRFALAGVALKFSGFFTGTGRLVIPAAGTTGQWIVKFPYTLFQAVVHNEFFCMSWARASGLTVPTFRLLTVDDVDGLPLELAEGTSVYAIERFDRDGAGARIHVEDMAQVLGVHPEDKYSAATLEDLAQVLAQLSPDDAKEVLARVLFMLLSGNGDAHLKNWGVHYPNGRAARLSPAYDLICTHVYPALGDRMALPFFDAETFSQVKGQRVAELATRLGLNPEGVLPQLTQRIMSGLTQALPSLQNPRWRAAIEAHATNMATRLLA